jgi:hypothetical protein
MKFVGRGHSLPMRLITRCPIDICFHVLVLKFWQIQKGCGTQTVSRMEVTLSFHVYLFYIIGWPCVFVLIFLLHSLT